MGDGRFESIRTSFASLRSFNRDSLRKSIISLPSVPRYDSGRSSLVSLSPLDRIRRSIVDAGISTISLDGDVEATEAKAIVPGFGGRTQGMDYKKTSYFLVATMVGAGFLSLPRAIADSGWVGIPMLVVFCGSVAFAASRLGMTWVMLEERWPHCRLPARQPYMEMAEKAFGIIGRKICFACVIFTLVGYAIAFIILISGMMNSLVNSVSICEWMVIVAAVMWPATFLGTPKDFWQASVLAVLATIVTISVVIWQLLIDIPNHDPQYPNPQLSTFSLGFSGILFAFGGVSVFPTLQNDMENRRDWWKVVVIGFTVVLIFYLPIAVCGYAIMGDAVTSNVLLDVSSGVPVTIAISLDIVNLLATFVIIFNPVGQTFEDIIGIPNNFNWKRVVLRSSILLFELLFSLAVPDFGSILNLIGGSTITILSFIFPPLMYLWMIDAKKDSTWDKNALEKTIQPWERIYLWMIVGVAVVGGIASTVSSLFVIIDPEAFGQSCFTNFKLSGDND